MEMTLLGMELIIATSAQNNLSHKRQPIGVNTMTIKIRENEPRINYLMRVLDDFMFMTNAGETAIDYDGTTRVGYCLAEDIRNELGIDIQEEKPVIRWIGLDSNWLLSRMSLQR
jgi:predicted transcriptional regulator